MRLNQKQEGFLRTCATLVCAKNRGILKNIDDELLGTMLAEGLRKYHDISESIAGKGKYLGHKYWSLAAWNLLIENNKIIDSSLKLKLRHEHLIPLKYLIRNKLFKLTTDHSLVEVMNQINTFSVVAIITKEEDAILNKSKIKSKMPQDWDGIDIFARYKSGSLTNTALFDTLIDIESLTFLKNGQSIS